VRIVGVIDLKDGRAVHASGGDRQRYQPVSLVDGDAIRLAEQYRRLDVPEIYVADLDAISGRPAQDAIVDALIDLGLPVWLDAGITTWQRAQELVNRGVSRVVIGLETLASFEALDVICISVGGERVAFCLDLRDGVPLGTADTAGGTGRLAAPTPPAERPTAARTPASASDIAARAALAGVGAIIVLDLARVGTGAGVDAGLIAEVRAAAPDVMLLAGGGVRGNQDVERLTAIGCDGALVATMLHDRLSR
jgi:phosphoribosylformimino-5-aminoimidazole carboxamide ribotide isomerase